ncbi:hypothetical protein BS47DRAFT_1302932, partial [Hydnum rufescens UP504]
MTEVDPGYCFASSHNQNIQSLRYLSLLAKDNAEWVYTRRGGKVEWKHVKVTLWMSKAQELNELLLVLMHMGGGQPARGKELFPTLYRNKQNVHRSLFVSPMGITWIINYNKTNSKQGQEKVIPRFAEGRLGQVLLKYFVHVRPSEEVFA